MACAEASMAHVENTTECAEASMAHAENTTECAEASKAWAENSGSIAIETNESVFQWNDGAVAINAYCFEAKAVSLPTNAL